MRWSQGCPVLVYEAHCHYSSSRLSFEPSHNWKTQQRTGVLLSVVVRCRLAVPIRTLILILSRRAHPPALPLHQSDSSSRENLAGLRLICCCRLQQQCFWFQGGYCCADILTAILKAFFIPLTSHGCRVARRIGATTYSRPPKFTRHLTRTNADPPLPPSPAAHRRTETRNISH